MMAWVLIYWDNYAGFHSGALWIWHNHPIGLVLNINLYLSPISAQDTYFLILKLYNKCSVHFLFCFPGLPY